jgi:hypothetical protein
VSEVVTGSTNSRYSVLVKLTAGGWLWLFGEDYNEYFGLAQYRFEKLTDIIGINIMSKSYPQIRSKKSAKSALICGSILISDIV